MSIDQGSGLLGTLLQTPVLVGVGVTMVVAGLGGWLTDTGDWYRALRKPSWQPPNWLFGPAWTTIFVLLVSGGVMAWNRAPDGTERALLLVLLAVNAVVNVAWSALFFRMQRPDWAGIEVVALWLSVASLVVAMARYAPEAAWCLAPYLAWVSFAAVLNWTIVFLNPRPGRTQGEAVDRHVVGARDRGPHNRTQAPLRVRGPWLSFSCRPLQTA